MSEARKKGYRLRPSQPKIKLSKKEADRLLAINAALARRCDYDSVQRAVRDAGNNDRVLIMPGHYTEPDSRSAPENDPKCNPSLLQRDASGDLTPSYEYQVTCPNDQNLIYVQGRAVVGDPLVPPLSNRQGIPAQELGPCVRCNLQIEGTGPKPEDVILDAGTDYEGTGAAAKPGGYAKHVVLRVDRADGFVGRNFLARGAREHTFYNEEVDGILLDRVKFFWGADYGHLSFTSDHNLVENCEGLGAGDAVVYPGAAPETGSQATDFYPDAPRPNSVIRDCDLHGSTLGYSGSMGNAVRITNNHIYGNTHRDLERHALGRRSSRLPGRQLADRPQLHLLEQPRPLHREPAGRPAGRSADRDRDHLPRHERRPRPRQLDLRQLARRRDAVRRSGRAHQRWRRRRRHLPRRVMPGRAGQRDFDLVRQPVLPQQRRQGAERLPLPGRDRHVRQRARSRRRRGGRSRTATTSGGASSSASNTGNCWFNNTGFDGTAASVTGPGEAGRLPGDPPQLLPSNCATSVGNNDSAKLVYLVDCGNGPDEDTGPTDCDWWTLPPKPGTAAAQRTALSRARAARAFEESPEADALRKRVAELTP